MTPEELAAYHRESEEAGALAVGHAIAKKRGEITMEEFPFHILGAAVSAEPFGGVAPIEDEEEMNDRAFDEGYNNRRLISDRILAAVGASSYRNRDSRFTRNQPVVISLVYGYGDPEGFEIDSVLEAASNLQRVIKTDDAGEIIFDLIPLEVYCFYREERASQRTSTPTGIPSWVPRALRVTPQALPGMGGPPPHETTHLKFYIKHLHPVVPDKADVIRTTVVETNDGQHLTKELDRITKISHDGRLLDSYWKYATIKFYPSLSALSSSRELDDESVEQIRASAVFDSKTYVDRLIGSDRAQGATRTVIDLG